MSEPLDASRSIETPEGVALELRVAGPIVRASAWAIDLSLRLALYGAGSVVMLFGDAGLGAYLIMIFATEWFYPVVFEVFNHGRTPGKLSMGLAVLRDDGTPVGFTESILRNFLLVADFLPGLYLLGLLSMLIRPDFKRLGDLAAGTVVVHRADRVAASALPEVRPESPPLALELEEQRAVIAFAQRAPDLTEERARELAALAEPLVQGREDAVVALFGQAAWLVGRRP